MHRYDLKALMTWMAQISVSKGRIGLKQNATHVVLHFVALSFWDSIFQAISYWNNINLDIKMVSKLFNGFWNFLTIRSEPFLCSTLFEVKRPFGKRGRGSSTICGAFLWTYHFCLLIRARFQFFLVWRGGPEGPLEVAASSRQVWPLTQFISVFFL